MDCPQTVYVFACCYWFALPLQWSRQTLWWKTSLKVKQALGAEALSGQNSMAVQSQVVKWGQLLFDRLLVQLSLHYHMLAAQRHRRPILLCQLLQLGATSILLSCLPIQLIPDPRFQIEKLTSMPIMHSLLSLRTPGEVRTWDNPTTWQWRDLGGLDVVAFITISNEMLPFFCGWLTRSRDHLSLEGSGDVWKV